MDISQNFNIFREQKLYANLKKCESFVNELIFLGYVVSNEGENMDPSMVQFVISSSEPKAKTIQVVQSFHGLASFYNHFCNGFSSITVPIAECLEGGACKRIAEAQLNFGLLKENKTNAFILSVAEFDKLSRLNTMLRHWFCFGKREGLLPF